MVKRHYRAVYRPRSFVFGALRTTGARTVQTVTLIGPDGVPATAHYSVERQPGGGWKIAGVALAMPKGERAATQPEHTGAA
jgi:hypothetical protein